MGKLGRYSFLKQFQKLPVIKYIYFVSISWRSPRHKDFLKNALTREPTFRARYVNSYQALGIYYKVNADGTTIFLTTYYMDEADQVSNWISTLEHGKIIVSGTHQS